jgi:hypothetical protein
MELDINNIEFDEVDGDDVVCQSCGSLPFISGPTMGCDDPGGCGLALEGSIGDEDGDEERQELNFDV